MKIRKLAALGLVNLLNNLLHAWHLIAVLERNFNTYLRGILFTDLFGSNRMDGDAGERDPLLPVQPMDAEEDEAEQNVYINGNDIDIESDSADETSTDDDDDDDALMSDSEYEDEVSDNCESCYRDYDPTIKNKKGCNMQCQRLPYTFKPQRLLKCDYKSRNGRKEYPFARSGHRVIASESDFYSLGGYNPHSTQNNEGELFQELWRYNFATMRWKLLLNKNTRNMPSELASNALVIANNILISYGGTGIPFGESCSNDCYIYTTGDKPSVVRLETGGALPIPQYGPGIVIHEHYLYTIGGTTGFDYSCDVFRLNFKTKLWECVYICRPDIREDPEGRYRHEVVYDGLHIYVLGGGTLNSVYDLQRLPAFNLKTNRWDYFDTLPDRALETTGSTARHNNGFPKPRKCFSCVQHTSSNGDIEAFITGGLQGDLIYFADIWKINLRTKQWTRIKTASLPKPLFFHAAAHSSNGCMYIFGGIEYDEKNTRRCNDLYKMWMTIPKLSEMCWEAVLHYNTNLSTLGRSRLLRMGIPLGFVQRLHSR